MPFQPPLPPRIRLIFSAIWSGGLRASVLMPLAYGSNQSADRRRVLETAFIPEIVQTAIDAERRARADVAIKHLAVIADGLYDPDDPALGHAKLFTEIAIAAEDAFQLRIFQFGLLIDVLRGHAELFGGEHREQRPFHQVEPLVIAVA